MFAKHDLGHWLAPVLLSLAFHLLVMRTIGLFLVVRSPLVEDSSITVELVDEPRAARANRAPPPRPVRSREVPRAPMPATETPAADAPTPPVAAEPDDASPSTRGAAAAQSVANPIVPLHQVTRLPGLTHQVRPVFPEAERARGKEARVMVEATIDEHGTVLDTRIVVSGGAAFDAAVVEALTRSVFSPALIGERAVRVRLQVPFQFKLD